MAVPRKWRLPRRFTRRLAAGLVLAGLLACTTPFLVSLAWWIPGPPAAARSAGTNALWLRHAWVGDAHSPGDYVRLAEVLRTNQISDAYFHVGPLDGDGRIPAQRYLHAPALLAALHSSAPTVHLQAYVGQLLTRAGGPLDLRSERVRNRVLESARALLDLGFDGIHYDIEPVAPSDGDFLDLLWRTRELTRAHRAILSASIQKVEPVRGASQALNAALAPLGHRWPINTSEFLRAVAYRVDQVAVMVYDTPLPTAPLIGAVYAWETSQVLQLIGDQTTVFIGVPTYEEHFHFTGEDLRTAIRGTRRGIAQLRSRPRWPYGMALFAEWTTSGREWAIWREDWLAPG
jgi:hypothetical protein